MATKKLETDTAVVEISQESIDAINQRLDSINQYMERFDWKLWMIMGMVRLIGEANGYNFSVLDKSQDSTESNSKETENE